MCCTELKPIEEAYGKLGLRLSVCCREKWPKSSPGAAKKLLEEIKGFKDMKNISKKRLEPIGAAITYFQNNIKKSRMDYAENVAAHNPIGSGVTEAACKTIVKQRLCQSGMRWKDKGAGFILSLRIGLWTTGSCAIKK